MAVCPQHGAHWELVWLPLGPLGCCGVCVYVEHTLADTERTVRWRPQQPISCRVGRGVFSSP